MAYTKFVVDNTTCSRRFHISYDDAAAPAAHVEVRCQFCNTTIFSAEQHPPVQLAREENLVKTAHLSDSIVNECHFEDSLSKRTIPPALEKLQAKKSSGHA